MSATTTIELSTWIEKLKSARNRNELFSMLDTFRALEWTDEQREALADAVITNINVDQTRLDVQKILKKLKNL